MTVGHICNLVVPGAAKSGTSALHDALGLHPQISMSSHKEPHYFSIGEKYQKGVGYHNSLFDTSSKKTVFGESSTGYMICPDAITRIANDLDDPKIIFVLRDPVERVFSHYRWRYRLGLETRELREALNADGYGYDPENPTRFGYMSYIQFSQYAKYCPLWITEFGQESCLFVKSDDLKNQQSNTLSKIHTFLGVEKLPSKGIIKSNETNAISKIPSTKQNMLATLVPTQLRRVNWLRNLWKSYLTKTAPTPPKTMSEEDYKFLEDKLSDDISFYQKVFN